MAGEVEVINQIAPKNAGDFPSHAAEFNKGGFREVADTAARDAITTERRTEGMHVYVTDIDTTYRLGSGLGNGDWVVASSGSGGITGTNQALDNPADADALATFLDTNYQPTFPTEVTAYSVFVRTTGDDDANDGTSSGAAFLTIKRALQKLATLNNGDSNATLDIGAGTFAFPRVLAQHYVTFQGATTVEDTFTIDAGGVIAADDTDGIVIDVTSTGGPYTSDELRGRHIKWTSGTSNGNEGWVYRNDATVTGVTRLYATHDSGPTTGIESMVATDTISLLTQDTIISLTGSTVLINSVQMNVRDIFFTASANTTLQCLNTDKVDFDRCYFDGTGSFLRAFRAGGYGRAFLTNCYVATSGTASGSFLSCQNNGYLQVHRGTVLDAGLNCPADPDARKVSGAAGSLLAFQGHVVCRGFDEAGIFRVDGLGIFQVGGTTAVDNILVEDANGTSTTQVGPVFQINSIGAGQGGWYQLPRLQGSITGDYSVEAQNGGTIIIGNALGTSLIGTGLGTNTVSANGGTSNVAQGPDLAFIEFGTPAFGGYAGRHVESFVDGDLSSSVLTVTHNLGQQFVKVAVYDDSNIEVAPDSVTATSATVCDIDLTAQGSLTGTWNVVVIG
ncbi:hypothetical protein N9917_00100 [Deltaproteobacteria bacterium]|nr:hypothetical protein [Deltaproteobacteria bacterium]